jgi:hypothetical protein
MQSHSPKISALASTAALLLALTLAPACAAPQRADTIQTAQIVVTTAANGLLLYDGPHEVELANTGTPDQAAAALAAYRAKRAKLNRALTVAADALIVAAHLNDQPSREGLAKAIAEVFTDYNDLKGATP